MAESNTFDLQRFHDLLLAGVRTAFRSLQSRFSQETIYFYALCLQVDFSTVAAGIKTEEHLETEISSFRQALRARQKTATAGEVHDLLRYDVPWACLDSQSNRLLAQAHAMMAAIGERFFEDEDLTIVEDETGHVEYDSPHQGTYDSIMQTIQRVLQELDAEGLFGVDETRKRVVVDVMWFEGGMSQSLPYLMGEADSPATPLNPGRVQERYHEALKRGLSIRSRLFSP